ncbi:MAG: transporter-related protein [Verrucomicrobia bacterium]|jgi:phospholipid/cholesterol/gamma-HCH transport system ATP-binding protein|nr:transporter-related protein [Verrucomicrobiota bacterium]
MIETHELSKKFGSNVVLDKVSFSVPESQRLVIIGRSGTGKSVLLKHLIGLMEPDSGEVKVDGEKITGLEERELLRVRSKFGMLFQSAALFDSLSVAENVGFVLQREGKLSAAEQKEKISEALEMVELAGTEEKKPSELSGGMRKRVGLARAIIYRPEIIVYDEPTTGLDPIVSDSIDKLILRVNEQLKATTIVVTHDMRTVKTVAQRVMMLKKGHIYVDTTPDELFSSQDPVVHQFVNGIADAKNIEFEP